MFAQAFWIEISILNRCLSNPTESPDMILYGLPTCTDCKMAPKALEDEGLKVTFRDVRGESLFVGDFAPAALKGQ